MKTFFCFLLIGFGQFGYCQDTTFFDNNWKVCDKRNAAFYRVVVPNEGLFGFRNYYINNVLQMSGQSTLKDSLVKQGEFDYYNEKGDLIESAKFLNNVKQGKSMQFFDNGKIKRVTNFVNGDFNGETIYYNSNGVLIGRGQAKDNYWYGKWEKYNDDGTFLTYLYYDDNYAFSEIGVKASTPNYIWIYFDKKEDDSLITYLCRPVNDKINALNKYSEAPDINIFIPKEEIKYKHHSSQFDYKFTINDTSLIIKNVKMDQYVARNNSFYTHFFIDVNSRFKDFTIAISVKEAKFSFYEPIINEFVNNLSFVMIAGLK